jgi:cell division topological specificity factor
MNLFRSLQLAASAPVARERLQILLEYERKLGSQIDLFTALREEILAVVSRHIVDPEKVQVTVDRGAKFSTLGVNIEIPNPGDKAGTLPTDCPVLQRDTKPWRRAAFVNKRQMMRGLDPAAETRAVPIWFAVGGAILLAARRAGGIALITSPFRVGVIAVMVLGAWLYVQQRDVSERRTLYDRNTFEEKVKSYTVISNAPHPAEGVVVATGPSVVLQGMNAPGTVESLSRVPAAATLASQSAVVTPLDTLESATSPREPPPVAAEPVLQSAGVTGSVTSSPLEPPPVAAEPVLQSAGVTGSVTLSPREPPPVAAEPVLQSAGVTSPATLGSATSPPNEPPTAPSQEPPPGNVTPLPPRRPLQIRIATPPRAVPPSALLRRREAP